LPAQYLGWLDGLVHGDLGYVNLLAGFFALMPSALERASLERFAGQVMPRFAPHEHVY